MYNQSELLKDLKKRRKVLEAELTKVNKAILVFEPIPNEFMRWKEKAMECIKSFNCYSQTVEILNCVFYDNPEILEDYVTRKRHMTALSVALGEMVKLGQLKVFKLYRVKGSFYGFPEWFGKDGKLLKEYFGERLILMNTDIEKLIMQKAA